MAEKDFARRLRFDWYNHLATLSLLILGGMMGFLPSGKMPNYAIIVLVLVGLGGALALGGSQRIVDGKPGATGWRRLLYTERYATALIGIGAGAFIGGYFFR